MAKIRGINPEFWIDDDIVELSFETRLFFIGLWNFSDDNGVFEWKPKTLKRKIFPDDEIDINKFLKQLEKKQIKKFTYKKKSYGIVVNFHKYQKPDRRYWKELIKDFKDIKSEILASQKDPGNPEKSRVLTRCPSTDSEGDSECEGEVVCESEKGEKKFFSPTPAQLAKEFFKNEEMQKKAAQYLSERNNANLKFCENEVKEFVEYWIERTPSGKKQLWETKKTFEIKRRLSGWFRNINNFPKRKGSTHSKNKCSDDLNDIYNSKL